MKQIFIATAAALVLATACTTTPEPAPPPPPETPTAPADAILPPPPPKPKDTCGADELQYLIGKKKTEIPVPNDPSRRRVACTTCPVTMDFREDRVNILFDADTGVIKEVKCG